MEDASLPSDEELARRAQGGDQAAFGDLVRRYQRPVFALVLRSTGSRDDTPDLCQDAFLRAWRGLGTFDTSRPFRPWIYRVALNVARTHRGRARGRIHVELDDQHPAPEGEMPDARAEARDAEGRLRAAVAELPPAQRDVLLLRVVEERSYKEISDVLDIPIGTVMSRLSRARGALRHALADPGAQDDGPAVEGRRAPGGDAPGGDAPGGRAPGEDGAPPRSARRSGTTGRVLPLEHPAPEPGELDP